MKKIVLSLIIALGLRAELVDRVVASVNNEPITSYDVAVVSRQMHISPNQALSYLIDQKILDEEIKKSGISVDDYDLENAMEKIAKQNGMSLYEFKNVLKQRGEYEKFKEALKNKLLKEKLFAQVINSKLTINPQEAKNYYDTHKNEFKVFKKIEVTKYESNNPKLLEEIINGKKVPDNVKVTKLSFDSQNISKNLLFLFKQTKVGEFTPVTNEGFNFVTYHIDKKEGETYLPYEKVQNYIFQKLAQQKREAILKEYFSKLRNRADIKIYND